MGFIKVYWLEKHNAILKNSALSSIAINLRRASLVLGSSPRLPTFLQKFFLVWRALLTQLRNVGTASDLISVFKEPLNYREGNDVPTLDFNFYLLFENTFHDCEKSALYT